MEKHIESDTTHKNETFKLSRASNFQINLVINLFFQKKKHDLMCMAVYDRGCLNVCKFSITPMTFGHNEE